MRLLEIQVTRSLRYSTQGLRSGGPVCLLILPCRGSLTDRIDFHRVDDCSDRYVFL